MVDVPRLAPLQQSGPPSAVDLFAFARISAAIAEGDRPLAEILEAERLTEAAWTAVTLFWTQRMAEDARNPEPRVALAFSDAFAKAQDAKKPVPALSVEQWAELVTAIEDHPNGPLPVLSSRGLGLADYARLVRHWAKALASDPARARAFESACAALVSRIEGV